jgi:hypothetical protein
MVEFESVELLLSEVSSAVEFVRLISVELLLSSVVLLLSPEAFVTLVAVELPLSSAVELSAASEEESFYSFLGVLA